jgi:hypothetical protein
LENEYRKYTHVSQGAYGFTHVTAKYVPDLLPGGIVINKKKKVWVFNWTRCMFPVKRTAHIFDTLFCGSAGLRAEGSFFEIGTAGTPNFLYFRPLSAI